MEDLARRSTESLLDQLWGALPAAWLGTSAGACVALGSIFWRFVVLPPRLVIAYSDTSKVWDFGGELYRQTLPPEIQFSANLILIGCVLLGSAMCLVSSARWREVHRELRRRRLG
jgi:hypothetical protein